MEADDQKQAEIIKETGKKKPGDSAFSKQADIVEAVRQGKPEVFEYLKSKIYGTVMALIMNNKGTIEDVKDVYGEGLARLITAINAPDFKVKKQVHMMLFVTCKNLWLDTAKGKKAALNYEKQLEEPVEEETLGDDMDRRVFKNLFWQNFEKLKEDCKTIINSVMDGLNYTRIGEKMGLSPAYVRKKKHYCYKSLIEYINQDPNFEEFKDNSKGEDNNYYI